MKNLLKCAVLILGVAFASGCETSAEGENDDLQWTFNSNTGDTNSVVSFQSTVSSGNSSVSVSQ